MGESQSPVMLETMFPHAKLERETSPKKFVATNGEQNKDLGEKSIPFKTNERVQCERSSEPETLWCWMERIRTSETFGVEQ